MSPNETDAVKRQRICTAARIPSEEDDNSVDFESEMDEEATYINDPVHGMLEIHPLCKAVIDTPEFQRLRFIKQCGITYFVYPGATHTRFDHSLGVCHLALKVVKRLNELEENAVSPEESLCIQLAGLCHDLGHGPFSHFWEYFVSYATDTKFHHEDMSVKIFDYLIEKNSLREKFEKYGLYDEHLQFIKDLILGTPSQYKSIKPKSFLFEIVANKENGLDIDKYEYLIKDSYFFGIGVTPDFERYLTCLKIVKDPDGVEHIGYREKLKTNIINVFKHRAEMHDIGYQHRVCKKIEAMLLDALTIADKHIEISVDNGEKYKLSECHENIEAILQLTDNVFEKILYSRDESLEEAKSILIRILNRKHYQQIYETKLDDLKTMKGIELTKKFNELLKKKVGEKYDLHFHCRTKELELGQNGSACDPLKNVWFVRRNGTVNHTERDPFLLPTETTCKKLFVFCKDDVEEEITKQVRDIIEGAKVTFNEE